VHLIILYFRDVPPGVFPEAVVAFGVPEFPVLPPPGFTTPLFTLLAAADCDRAARELRPVLLPALAYMKNSSQIVDRHELGNRRT